MYILVYILYCVAPSLSVSVTLYLCCLWQGCSGKEAVQSLLWRLSPDGCVVWRAAPVFPPVGLSALSRPAGLSANAYCEPEPTIGSLGRPGYQIVRESLRIRLTVWFLCVKRTTTKQIPWSKYIAWLPYVDHGVGGDAEKRGSLRHLPNLFTRLSFQPNSLQLRQGPERKHKNQQIERHRHFMSTKAKSFLNNSEKVHLNYY